MMVTMDFWLRRMVVRGKQLWLRPRVRVGAMALGFAGMSFGVSAASLRNFPQPVALGLVFCRGDWLGLCAALGSCLGYRVFWGQAGMPGVLWALAAAVLNQLAPPGKIKPMLSALVVGCTGLWFRFGRGAAVPFGMLILQMVSGAAAVWTFGRKDRTARWLQWGFLALALGQILPFGYLNLGTILAGALAVGASFPAAAVAGLGLDLARVTLMPMSAVLTAAWLGRLLNLPRRLRWAIPGAVYLGALAVWDSGDFMVLPGLLLGGGLGLLFPRGSPGVPRRGETGMAQVRLELAAGVMGDFGRSFLTQPPPGADREAMLQRLRGRTCGRCALRKSCMEQQRLTVTVLEDNREFPCRKPGRMGIELARTREQLRLLKAEHRRREEYREAMVRQYRFLQQYLQHLSDSLPRRGEQVRTRYAVSVSVRTRGRSFANGDRWAAFPGSGGRYFVLLCDGMGSGPGAQEEGKSAIRILRQLLLADFSPEQALRSINSLLTLGGRAGAVTVDLVELRLDTGMARLFKWGAAPSWRVKDGHPEQIGTATLPPGVSVKDSGAWTGRVLLKKGELLVLVSDGVDPEEIQRRIPLMYASPPGELAQRLLEGEPGGKQDDATAAVIHLRPGAGAVS